jgi:hypothetical protein
VSPDLVLAHYGGVPEALTFGLPIAIFAGFVLLEKRARRRERERAAEQIPPAEPGRPTEPGPAP